MVADLEWKAGVLPLHGVIGAAAQARGRGRAWAWARIASRSGGGGGTSSRRPAWTIWLRVGGAPRGGKRRAGAVSRGRAPQALRGRDQQGQVDARVVAHAFERMRNPFAADVATGPGCVGAAAEAAERHI